MTARLLRLARRLIAAWRARQPVLMDDAQLRDIGLHGVSDGQLWRWGIERHGPRSFF